MTAPAMKASSDHRSQTLSRYRPRSVQRPGGPGQGPVQGVQAGADEEQGDADVQMAEGGEHCLRSWR